MVGTAATVHTTIPIGKGVCGWAAKSGRTEIVSDVSKDPRYLECFTNTKSEIVVPIHQQGKVVGEIDIDSDELNAHSSVDREFLEAVASKIAKILRLKSAFGELVHQFDHLGVVVGYDAGPRGTHHRLGVGLALTDRRDNPCLVGVVETDAAVLEDPVTNCWTCARICASVAGWWRTSMNSLLALSKHFSSSSLTSTG